MATGRQKQAETIKGAGNPNWKGGRILKQCVRCGIPFHVYPSQNHHTHCSLACANRDLADAQRGISNKAKGRSGPDNGMFGVSLPQKKGPEAANWKGGLTPLDQLIRSSPKYEDWRLMVFGRDAFTCQQCGKRGCYLEAHHKIALSKLIRDNHITNSEEALACNALWELPNGITLCLDCHKQTPNYANRQHR